MRYAAESGLRQIDVRSFTVLVERVNIRSLRRFHERGVPGAILTKSQEMPLPEPFWLHYHASIRNSDHSLSKLYFMEISDYLYPPVTSSLGQQVVLYSIAYVYKNQLDKYFAPSFVKRLEALSTWGGDKTTSCIRAHFLLEGVNFEVDLGGLNLEPRPLDVLTIVSPPLMVFMLRRGKSSSSRSMYLRTWERPWLMTCPFHISGKPNSHFKHSDLLSSWNLLFVLPVQPIVVDYVVPNHDLAAVVVWPSLPF